MFLGVWWNPFSWGQDILDGIVSFFYGILLTLDCIIYSFVSYVYQIFLVLAQGGKLIDDKFIGDLVNRIYIIIGVVMLFLIAYSLLKSMVNPDEALKGKQSPVNLIKDVIISVALIALLPTIFEFAFDFQNSLLINNTIGKIIVGAAGSGSSDPANTIRDGGYIMSEGVFKAFLHANPEFCDTKAEESNGVSESGEACKIIEVDNKGTTYGDLWDEARNSTTFWALARVGPSIIKGEVNYYFLIAPAAGIFVLFVLLQYCLDMALRLVKLAVYEVIAPIPIFARIMPNEQAKKVFSNWLKVTMSTFTEVFIRIAILYFAVFLISTVTASINDIFGTVFSGSARLDILLIAQALIIVGIILFVKQAPEIIKEITGLDAGKYGKSLMKGIGMMTATLGGGATAMIRTAANDKDNHGLKKGFNAFKAGMGAGARGLWHGNKVEKFGDMPKAAGKAASNTLDHRAKVAAAGGNGAYLKQWIDDKGKDIKAWKSGGFEDQQKMLDTINAITQNADAVKSKTEGFIRDKKYIFKYGEDKSYGEKIIFEEIEKDKLDANGNVMTDSDGKVLKEIIKQPKPIPRAKFDANTSLAEMEAMIQSLKSTGDIEDAKVAAEIDSDMNKRIKAIGQELSKVASTPSEAGKFNREHVVVDRKTGQTKFDISSEAAVELSEAKSQFELMKKRVAETPTIADFKQIQDAQSLGKIETDLTSLPIEQSADLSKALKSSAADIQQQITLEQERRKAKEKK